MQGKQKEKQTIETSSRLNLLLSKGNKMKQTKRQAMQWEKIFSNDVSVKDWYPKSIKNLSNSTPSPPKITQIRNGQKI